MREMKVVSVFISSPSDVAEEREIVNEVLQQINEIKGASLGYEFTPLRWENDVSSSFGQAPQDIIDRDIGDDYDVFLGIMSTRFGSPTSKSNSGTEHEFTRALERKRETPNSIEILFFFQDPGFSGRRIDADELKKVENFKSEISDEGLYKVYRSTQDFKAQLTTNLTKVMEKVINRDSTVRPPTKMAENVEASKKSIELADPLGLLNNLDDSDELGFLDHFERIDDSFRPAASQLRALQDAMENLTLGISKASKEISEGSAVQSLPHRKKVMRSACRPMDAFVETSTQVLPIFRDHLNEGLNASRDLMIILSNDNVGSTEDRAVFTDSLESMREAMRSSLDGFMNLSNAISNLPRATSDFNRSKRRTKAIVDGICNLIESAIAQLGDVLDVVE